MKNMISRGFSAAIMAVVIVLPSLVLASTYYISGSGSDSNTGLSTASAFLTIQKAANLTNPGDTVMVMNGTYANSSAAGDVVSISRSGNSAAGIVYKAYPGHTPLIQFNGWTGFNVKANYITIDGFEIVGNAKNVTLAAAQAQASNANNPLTSGSGIAAGDLTGANLYHHLVFRNNKVHDCSGSGIEASYADYVTIQNNTVYNNASWSPLAKSGISIFESKDFDANSGYKNYVLNNLAYNNEEFIANLSTGSITDGHGIIINDNKSTKSNNTPYGGRTLVANNITFGNGGSGIYAVLSQHVDIVNNTAYMNNHSPAINNGQILSKTGNDNFILNNILYAPAAKTITAADGAGVTYDYNVNFNGTSGITIGSHDLASNPMFVNATAGDLHLLTGSPAINSGTSTLPQSTDYNGNVRPVGTLPDRGAYEYTAAALADGSSAAPAGTGQIKSLLDGYVKRPTWQVAGVDYAVGPKMPPTKDPAAISMSGVSVDPVNHWVTITGNNITLDGYNFYAGNKTWQIHVQGAANTIISNCNVFVGSDYTGAVGPIVADSNSANLIVRNCVIDGNRRGGYSTLVSMNGGTAAGGVTLEYNWLKGSPQHITELNTGAMIYRYNLIESFGWEACSHPNATQFNGGASAGNIISYNTIYEDQSWGFPICSNAPYNGIVATGEMIQFEAQLGGTITNSKIGNNVIIAKGNGGGSAASYLIVVRQGVANAVNGVNIHDNYLDTSGAWGPFYPISGSNVNVFNTVNLTTGLIFPTPAGATSNPSGSDTVPPSMPTGLTATAASSSQINLIWIASTDAVSVTGYKIFRNGVQVGTSITPAYSSTGLTPSTSYSFTVLAYDAANNNSTQSSSASATTLTPLDSTAPSVPTGLAATTTSTTQINLTWTASTDNVAVTGYKVYRNGVQVGTSTTASYSSTGLTASTAYSFTVSAHDVAGNNSAQTASVSATTQNPVLVWNNMPFAAQAGNFMVRFNAVPTQNAEDVVLGLSRTAAGAYTDLAAIIRFANTGLIDVRNGAAYTASVSVPYTAGSLYQFREVINMATHTYSVYVTAPGQAEVLLASNYAFRSEQAAVVSLANLGKLGDPGDVSVTSFSITTIDSQSPSVPVNVKATVASSSQINLSWDASSDNVAVTGYKVFRNGVQIATSTIPSYSSTGLSSSTTYYYRVSAYDSAGNNSARSSSVSARTLRR